MAHEQQAKTQTLKIQNLESEDTPQELADEEARHVAGGAIYMKIDGVKGIVSTPKASDLQLLCGS